MSPPGKGEGDVDGGVCVPGNFVLGNTGFAPEGLEELVQLEWGLTGEAQIGWEGSIGQVCRKAGKEIGDFIARYGGVTGDPCKVGMGLRCEKVFDELELEVMGAIGVGG